jgi:hypothetical protein
LVAGRIAKQSIIAGRRIAETTVLLLKAEDPRALSLLPVVFNWSASIPIAVLSLPVVL